MAQEVGIGVQPIGWEETWSCHSSLTNWESVGSLLATAQGQEIGHGLNQGSANNSICHWWIYGIWAV